MSQTWLQYASTYEEELNGFQTGITAAAAGGQAAATQLTKKFNSVDTVAAINASVKLPAAKVGKKCFILNNAVTASLNICVFPQAGEYIDGVQDAFDNTFGLYTARIPGAGQMAMYECYEDGKWRTGHTPKLISMETRVIVSQAQILTSHTAPVILIPQHGQMTIDPISIRKTSAAAGYITNVTGQITCDPTGAEAPHSEFNFSTTHNAWQKLPLNPAGAYMARQTNIYFFTRNGNPGGTGGQIQFHIAYNLYLD